MICRMPTGPRVCQVLDLSHNRLTAFPLDLPLLYCLHELLIGTNDITEIPKDISKMKNLVKLDLSDNYLSLLPETLIKIQTLKQLDLTNNMIMQWPTNFVKLQDKVNVSKIHVHRLICLVHRRLTCCSLYTFTEIRFSVASSSCLTLHNSVVVFTLYGF